jgi:hypothetical protein
MTLVPRMDAPVRARRAAESSRDKLHTVTDDLDPTGALPDGSYDALVVDAVEHDDGSASVDLTIVAGTSKGEVVTLRASGLEGDPLDLLGVPATITVADGTPSVRFEA